VLRSQEGAVKRSSHYFEVVDVATHKSPFIIDNAGMDELFALCGKVKLKPLSLVAG
jgi:hypothetical protein